MDVLETEYTGPSRPYSIRELQDKQENLYNKLRIGKIIAYHKNCGHFYYTRKNGRKEKEIARNSSIDSGNCSVCWKLFKTDEHLKDKACSLVQKFSTKFSYMPHLTHENVFLENVFYEWLYGK